MMFFVQQFFADFIAHSGNFSKFSTVASEVRKYEIRVELGK